jgi:hypothetical protein
MSNGKVGIRVPEIDGVSLLVYPRRMLGRLLSFVENIVVYSLKNTVNEQPIIIVEIPAAQRDNSNPKRFGSTIKQPSVVAWDIKYSDDFFVD